MVVDSRNAARWYTVPFKVTMPAPLNVPAEIADDVSFVVPFRTVDDALQRIACREFLPYLDTARETLRFRGHTCFQLCEVAPSFILLQHVQQGDALADGLGDGPSPAEGVLRGGGEVGGAEDVLHCGSPS